MRSKKLSVLGFGQVQEAAAAAAGQHGRAVPGPDSIADIKSQISKAVSRYLNIQ